MPIYEVNGKRANVKDASVNKFLGQYPDAKLIDNEPYSIVRQGSTPRQSSIQKQTGTQVEEYPVQQPNGGLTGGFTTFQDGTSGFIPAMKMPDIKIEQPKPGLPKSQITKGTPFENKTLLDSTQETVRNMPVSPEAHFDSEQSVYEQNQDWIKEVQNDPSMSPEVKQSLIDDYNKNIRISNNTIEDKDLPLYAKKWLDNNKVSVPTTVYVPGSPMFGGGQYVESTKQANTPEQIAFIKDFIANTPQGQDLVNKQKAYVEYLENSISDVETRVPELKKKYWQEQYDLSRSHPYPMGKTNGKAETDAARKDYIEKSNAISERMSALNLAEKNAEDQKKLLTAVRDGDLNVLSQFGKQIGRDFWEMSGDIGTLGIRPMMQSLYESSDVKGLQDRMDKGELTNEDRLAMSAMANNQAYQELMGDRRTIAQEVASGITQSAPFMVNFATTGGIGKAVTGGAKELLKQGIKRNAINAIKQGAKIGTEKLGARLAGFGLNVADATGRASVMAAISPHTYRDMFDNMTGQVTYGYDEEGKPYYLGNVEQMDIANALFNAWRSNTIENVSEFSGFGMEKGQVALSRLLKQRVPEVAKALSFGSTRNQFFQGVNKAMRAAGFNGTVNEFLEEQVATVLHSFFEDGQAQWSDLVDPRQQFITYLTVAAIGSGSAIMNTGGNQLMKHGAKKAYNNAFQDFGTEFYNSQNNDIAGQFADAVRNGTIEEKQSALANIVNSNLFNDKQKLAALNLYRAGLTYESYEGAKEAHVEEATQEIPAMIEENANPEMDAVVSATVAGMDTPVQIIGGNIEQNEDGTINREQSDKEIYYVDADGNRQVISIQYVDNITENVPTQDAIAQVTEQVAAPIIAQQENEEVRPYEAGETVRFSPDGNTSLVGQIIGQNEDGSYILQEVTTGQQVSVQPRQIINEDNLQGVENGSPVIYTNQNGEQVQDIVATSPDLYAQGLIAFENGDVVKIENVVGLAGNNEQISQFENNENSGRPRNIENSTIENNIRIENQEHTNKNTLATNEPRVFEIEEGLSAVENADGTYALDKQFAKSELKKADSLVKRLNEDYSDNGLVFETVQLPRKDASNPFEKPLWGVVARIQQELPIQEQSETPSQNRENEHLWNVAENSDSPIDIASAYNEAMQTAGEEALDEWQKQLLGKKINRVSFERFGDRNLINGATARSWFNRKGEESTSGSIDIIAQELGVDVQSIIDFIVDHPSNRIKKGNDLTQSLNTRFKEIAQSITGREVGGIESNSGKLFLSTLEYAANNTPTEVETEFMQSDVISSIPNAVEFFLSDYMRLDEISDFNQFRDTVEEADKQGYFMFPLESKDKETILNYINNAEQQANAIQGIGENVSDESIIENVEQPTIQEQIAQTETGRFPITETKDGKYQVIDTESNQPKSRTYDNRKSAKKQQHALYEALSQANKTIEELESYPYFSKESQDQAKRTLSILDSFDPSNITLQDANKIIDIISNKPVPFYQVQQALDTKSIMIGNQDYYTPDYLKKYIMYSTKDIPAQGSISEKIAQAEAETNTNPTEAQKEAGNYKKGKVTIQGLDISIEQPKGSVRSGVDANGKEWSIAINNTYGYIRGTEGKDGDHIDVFLGENPESPALFVVDQVNQDGNFDEHKVMLGFESIEEARDAYLSNYEEGWQGLGNITQSDMDTFKKWANNDTRKIKPFAEYKDIQDNAPAQKEMLSEVKKRKKDGKYVVELDRRMSKTPLVLMARRALQYNGKWRKASNSIEFDNEADAKAFRENERSLGDGTHYQSSTNIFKPVNPDKFNWVISQLEKTGLAKEIITDPTLFREKLDEVINDNTTAKQVLSEMETIKQEAIANDTFMLAPNGKPTNLNENQWLQVRTKPFLDWFGDWIDNPEAASKVVDDNGEPMVVYHGSKNAKKIKEFSDARSHGRAYWFSPDYDFSLFEFGGEKKGNVLSVFLSSQNILDFRSNKEAFNDFSSWVYEKDGARASADMESYVRSTGLPSHADSNIYEYAREKGYDGIVLQERVKAMYGDDVISYAVFDPTQIKSAISNNGEFDSRNADIRMQVLEDSNDLSNIKEKQLATILKYNPAPNDYNTWVRTTDDILTAEEAFRETLVSNDSMYPDFTDDDMQKAIEDGVITVYSSYPIKKGVFVTPSFMNAEEYAGGGKVYSKTIKLTDVAWIDESEGQYTPVKFMRTNVGDVYGFVTPDGTVYLDSTRMNANTPVHEFGHLWNSFTKENNPDLYNRGAELVKESEYWQRVNDNPSYRDLSDDAKVDEALAMAIGDKGEFIINDKSIGHKLLDWIQSVWEWIGSKIGIRDLNSSQLQNITLSQFTELAAADLLGGKDIANIPAGPEVLNDIRFQSVNDVADATDSTMTEEMRNELDKRIKNLWFRIREAYEDRHLAVKEFLDVLRENGTEVAEYDDFYNKVTHINGAIDAQLEQYNKKYQKPLNKAISELEKAGFDYRDIENYAILKHGLERNAWMKQDLINQYMENNPEATPQQIGTFELNLPNDFSGITAVEKEVGKHAEWFINDFEEKAGKDLIDNLWKRVNDATSYSLNKQLKGQLIDKKTIEDLKNRYDYYIPLRGHDAEVAEDKWDYSPDMGAYFVAPLLKARGRKTRSESPFAYIASMAQSAINSANRNILNQTILRLALKDKSGLLNVNKAWYEKTGERDGKPVYEVLSPEYNEDPDTYRKNIEEFEERMAKLADAGLAVQSGKKLDIGGLFIKRKQADQHEVHVFQNGTEYVVYINANPAVARAINGSNAKDLHKDLRFFAKVSRQMAANFTTRNPIFVASNFSRDYIFSSSILPVKENAKYALQFQRNMPRSADALQRYVRGKADLNKQQDRYLNEYILNGAKTGFSHILELQKVQKQIERDIKQGGKKGVLDYSVRPILEGLEAMNEIAENMSRLSVYITSREQGRSITQSVTDAKEVTVNFNRSGAGGLGAAWFRSLYLFVNAGVQALSNFAKVAQKNKAKTAVLISSYAMSGFAIMPMLSYLIGGDDGLDEYFKISDWERQNNLCIYTGNGFIKIPLPHELRVFHKMGDEIYQSTFGKKDVTQSLLDTALGFSDLIPANPMGAVDGSWADIMPDATKPFFQLAANRNFTGSRITNEWADPNKPGYLRVRTNKKGEPFAPAFLVKLAETLDNATGGDGVEKGLISFNPDVVNHLMRGYFGGLYNMGMQGLDLTSKTYDWTKTGEFKLKARETPAKTFYTSESDLQTSNSGLNTKYFKLVDDTQETIRKVKGYKDQVADGELSVTDFYSKIENLNVPKANELYGHIKQIKKYESALKELDGQDQKDLEKIIADLKKQSIEINNSLSK